MGPASKVLIHSAVFKTKDISPTLVIHTTILVKVPQDIDDTDEKMKEFF
jgi:hypothetical protein